MTWKRIVAFVPMRHDSERVPGKNYRLIHGRPLFHYILETLLICPEIDQVVVDTDSLVIMEGLRAHFPQVTLLERPIPLRAGTVSMNEVLLHDIEQCPGDLYLQTHATNPLLRSETVSRAIQSLRAAQSVHDSLFSVTRRQVRLWDEKGLGVNHDPGVLLRTQDLPPFFEENSSVYLFTGETLKTRGTRIGERPMMFETSPEESWDIDTEFEFAIAEFLLARRGRSKS
jgi:CMP-N-acetylneuraminic acid synthetase